MFDMSLFIGTQIPIREHSVSVVTVFRESKWVLIGVNVCNLAFDITLSELMTKLIIEKSMVCPLDPYKLRELFSSGS